MATRAKWRVTMFEQTEKTVQVRRLKLMLTGGGTAGHVMPHIAMLPHYHALGWDVRYIGSAGIERQLVTQAGLPFFKIAAGKLRRYVSFKNLLDIFNVALGTLQSLVILARNRPDVVFSKGGFVSVPVAVAGWLLRIPVISHESDLTPGLATKIISRFSRVILTSFPESARYVANAHLVGIPIRDELKTGSREEGLRLCGFAAAADPPVVLVMGGSQGAQRINDTLHELLPELVTRFRIIHLTGQGKALPFAHSHYKAFDFLGSELKHVLAAADVVVSRAGANSIFELRALQKPMLLIPLEVGSRGDQVDNAISFVARQHALMVRETELTSQILARAIDTLVANADRLRKTLAAAEHDDPAAAIISMIQNIVPSTP